MLPCYAITSSHLGLLWDRKRLQVRSYARMLRPPRLDFLRDLYLIVRTLLRLCSVREEVASFLKHIKTKRKRAVCSSLGYCCPLSLSHRLNGNYCRLPIQRGDRACWRAPLTPPASRGKRRELSKLTRHPPLPPPLAPVGGGCFSSSCCPTGLAAAHSC